MTCVNRVFPSSHSTVNKHKNNHYTRLVWLALGFVSLGLNAQEVTTGNTPSNTVQGVHQVLDPSSNTDDLGISIPIPISHPARRYPSSDNFPTGPDIGERLPTIRLPNQHGQMVDFHQREVKHNGAVVFFRSVSW